MDKPLNQSKLSQLLIRIDENIFDFSSDDQFRSANHIKIVELDTLKSQDLLEFYKEDQVDFAIRISREILNHDKIFEVVLSYILHPRYYFHYDGPLILLECDIDIDYKSNLDELLSRQGYKTRYFFEDSMDQSIFVTQFNGEGGLFFGDKLSLSKCEDIPSIVLKSNYLLANEKDYDLVLQRLREFYAVNKTSVNFFQEVKRLMSQNDSLQKELKWKNNQLKNYSVFLELLKNDRTLILASRAESIIKKVGWLKKLAKKVINITK